MGTFSNMDERIEEMNQVAQHGNIGAFFILIREDVKLLEDINQLPFVETPLHIAASAGHIPMAMELMRLMPSFAWKPNTDGFSPIHLDLLNGQTQMVLRLLKVDGDLVHVQGREGMTPLHYAATKTFTLNYWTNFSKSVPNLLKM